MSAAIRCEGLGKAYRHFAHPRDRIVQLFWPAARRYHDVWVVRDVSFSVAAGESVAILGGNGAGKTTILLRTYSSGMNVRLAFSLATAVRPDVLIIDEALAVGDQNFQQKSLARIRELQDGGTSLLFVSHEAAIIPRVCRRALILEHGSLRYGGSVDEAIAEYNQLAVSRPRSAETSAGHG